MALENIITGAGTKISFSASLPATYTPTGFAAVTGLAEVGNVLNIGDIAQQMQDVAINILSSGTTYHLYGSLDIPAIAVSVARDAADAGMAVVDGLFAGRATGTVKIELADTTVFWCSVKIMSVTTTPGDNNTTVGKNFSMQLYADHFVEVLP